MSTVDCAQNLEESQPSSGESGICNFVFNFLEWKAGDFVLK